LFSLERFVEACRAAMRGSDSERAVQALVTETVADAGAVATALGEPKHAGFEVIVREPDLTILDFAWAPWMPFKPHDHAMWSVVGLYAGREDNLFWRRKGDRLEAAGARSLGAGDATILGRDVIHSVVNPVGKWSRALHVYGGDFFEPPRPRSEWDPETLAERPWNIEHTRQLFIDAEARSRV
jgi:predicted metal-dependent enzyme (double-stranded beta helix superfamily)